jgi:ribonuclease HI
MYFDGSLNLEGAGAGVLLISPTGEQLKYALQIFWKVSNNEAEYEALLHGLHLAASLGIERLLVYGDSAVVINQVNKSWDRNKENMDAYCLQVRKLENKFYGLEFHHSLRQLRCSRRPVEARFYSRSSTSGRLRTRASRAIHPGAGAIDHCPSASARWPGGHDDRRGLEATLHRLPQRAEGSLGQKLG